MLNVNETNRGAIETKRLAKLEPDLSFEQSRDDLLDQALTTETEIKRHLQQ
jgi:hypothetical protein